MSEPTPNFKVGDPVIYAGSNVGMVGETGKIDFIESTKFFVKFDNRAELLPVHADALVLDHRCDTTNPPAADRFADPGKVIEPAYDPVNKPKHYNSHPSGVECITITEHENFCIGNAIKYLWRADQKGRRIEDLEKAAWYVNREIQRLKAIEETHA